MGEGVAIGPTCQGPRSMTVAAQLRRLLMLEHLLRQRRALDDLRYVECFLTVRLW